MKKGVESLGFEIAKDLISVENLKTLLHGIDVENVELNFSTCMKSTVKLAETVAAYFKTTSIDLTKVSGSIRFNPFKRMLTKGRDFADYADQAVAIIDEIVARIPCIVCRCRYVEQCRIFYFSGAWFCFGLG